jgi:hypothetical protein
MNLEGGCSCRSIRYKLTNTPLIVHACHCRDCQRVTGSAFVINIWIEKRFVESSGAMPKSIVLKGGTGKDHEAFFCDQCGTYLWSRYQVAPGGEALFVRAGTLDARRSHLHEKQAELGETPGKCDCVRNGLQDRRGLAGRKHRAPSP